MSSIATRITARGFLPNKQSVDYFIDDFVESGLATHQRRKMRVKFLLGNGQYRITLDLDDSSEKIVRDAFTGGALRHWGKLFQISKG